VKTKGDAARHVPPTKSRWLSLLTCSAMPAISRFTIAASGLRYPSEHLSLRRQDVDWERNRFCVDSPKTGQGWVPIFPELRPYLEECFELAQEGAVYVITRYRTANANLRTTFTKIIKRAGEKPWPKLFHNLRASRETELAAEHPIHVVCEWIGNKAAIAAKHYLTVREEDFERATKGGTESGAPQAHFQAQQTDAGYGAESQDSSEFLAACDSTPLLTCRNSLLQNTYYPQGDSNPCLSLERAMS
jgi:hypothetical protein